MHDILIDPCYFAYLKKRHRQLRGECIRVAFWPALHRALLAKQEAEAMTFLGSPELRYCADEVLWLAATMGLDGVFDHVAKRYRAPSLNCVHLFMACLAGDEHAVELFGLFVDHWQWWDEALICAARSGNAALVKNVLPRSNARAHSSQALVEACGVGSLEVVRLLLPQSLQIAAAARALPLAAARGDVDIVEAILASPLPDRETACYRAWEYAVKYGHANCAEMLC